MSYLVTKYLVAILLTGSSNHLIIVHHLGCGFHSPLATLKGKKRLIV